MEQLNGASISFRDQLLHPKICVPDPLLIMRLLIAVEWAELPWLSNTWPISWAKAVRSLGASVKETAAQEDASESP